MKKRTSKQSRALHLMFEHIAKNLNDAGLDMRRTLKQEIDIPWSKETVKEHLFRPIMKAQLEKDSTTKLSTKEIDLVVNTLTRHLGQRFGIQVSFPSTQELMYNREYEENN